MSLYSIEPENTKSNNLAQHTEGFECGLDINDNLMMLSESEQALYDDTKKAPKNVAAPVHVAPVEEEDQILDDSIYEEPSGHVTFADSGLAPVDADESDVEGFTTGSVIDTVKGYAGKVGKFAKANWMVILIVLLAICLAYCYFNGKLPFMSKISKVFSLSDASSSFKASSSSLGSNVARTRMR
jgi:hypothetical protein